MILAGAIGHSMARNRAGPAASTIQLKTTDCCRLTTSTSQRPSSWSCCGRSRTKTASKSCIHRAADYSKENRECWFVSGIDFPPETDFLETSRVDQTFTVNETLQGTVIDSRIERELVSTLGRETLL